LTPNAVDVDAAGDLQEQLAGPVESRVGGPIGVDPGDGEVHRARGFRRRSDDHDLAVRLDREAADLGVERPGGRPRPERDRGDPVAVEAAVDRPVGVESDQEGGRKVEGLIEPGHHDLAIGGDRDGLDPGICVGVQHLGGVAERRVVGPVGVVPADAHAELARAEQAEGGQVIRDR